MELIRQSFAFIAILIAFQLSHVSMSLAADELIFGPELTFTNDRILKSETLDRKEELIAVAGPIKRICSKTGKCTVELGLFGEIKSLQIHEGPTLYFTADPGVIEIKATPQTLKEWSRHKEIIQEALFDAFAEIGVKPHEREGAGHLNIGLHYFEKHPMALRNFIVDFYNHEGVGTVLNSLEANREDAPYLSQMKKIETQYVEKSFRKNLEALDKIENLKAQDVAAAFGPTITKVKYRALGIRETKFWYGTGSVPLGLSIHDTISSSSRLEVRVLRPQASMADFIKVMEIFEARIQYLKKFRSPIELNPVRPINDGWVALGQFADYLKEAGLDWKNYKSLMPAVWRDLPEQNFIRNDVKTIAIGKLKCSKVH